MNFIILGPPRTKKNHGRLVRAGGKLRLLPSAAHEVWAHSAVRQLRAQRQDRPLDSPVAVAAVFFRERNVGDLVNYMQALADALEKAGVITNDRLIVSWDGSRLAKDAQRPRVELVVEHFEVAAASTNNLTR
jgi:Holliday junction resolvase RusA-like endonuclease